MQFVLKKSLGQHFLKDEIICRRIADEIASLPLTHLLEIGAGGGALTKYLLKIPNIDFKTVEIDEEKVHFLEKTYPTLEGKIIHKDFLEMDTPFQGQSFIVAGNFPYNISSQIVFKILEWKNDVTFLIGMFQKEVALRIASKPGNKTYGILSVLVQAFYEVEYLFDVPPESFTPPPNVMSGIIKFKRKTIIPEMRSEKALFTLVKTAFNQRRKMLRNAVGGIFTKEILAAEIFNKRAEQLSVEDFAMLTFKMN